MKDLINTPIVSVGLRGAIRSEGKATKRSESKDCEEQSAAERCRSTAESERSELGANIK